MTKVLYVYSNLGCHVYTINLHFQSKIPSVVGIKAFYIVYSIPTTRFKRKISNCHALLKSCKHGIVSQKYRSALSAYLVSKYVYLCNTCSNFKFALPIRMDSF